MMNEVWKDITGYEGLYQISNLGRVKALPRNIPGAYNNREFIKKTGCDRYGYPQVGLSKNGKYSCKRIHQLVAMEFVPNPHNLKEVNHKDENKSNNHADNLEWCTAQYNLTYGHRLDNSMGEKHHKHKLTEEQIKEIRRIYVKNDLEFGQSALSKKYGVSHQTIGFVVRHETWKHVKEGKT